MRTKKIDMKAERIKEIQEETAYPDSVSVYKALLKVWNECQQQSNQRVVEELETIEDILNSENSGLSIEQRVQEVLKAIKELKTIDIAYYDKVRKDKFFKGMTVKYGTSEE